MSGPHHVRDHTEPDVRARRQPTTETHIAHHGSAGVTVRGMSLEKDLIGKVSYTESIMLGTLGRLPDPNHRRLLDGCLVALMEGGLNPSTLITRMVSLTAPDQAQAAMAAGLLTVGDVYVGSVQDAARLLATITAGDDTDIAAADAVADLQQRRARVPGLGHGRHHAADPRATAILELATDCACAGPHGDALAVLHRAATEQLRRPLVINVTGAVAAALLDLGFPTAAVRPLALAARAGGLVGHLVEERDHPTAKALWDDALSRVEYRETEPENQQGLEAKEVR